MADIADLSMEVDVNQVIMEQLNNPNKVDVPSNYFCVDCEDDIPEERRKGKNITHCVMCQTRIEKQSLRAI